jgi:hypothetical protein
MNIVSSVSSKSLANIKLILAVVVVAMVASHVYTQKVADKPVNVQEQAKKYVQMVNYGVVAVLGFLVVSLHMKKRNN